MSLIVWNRRMTSTASASTWKEMEISATHRERALAAVVASRLMTLARQASFFLSFFLFIPRSPLRTKSWNHVPTGLVVTYAVSVYIEAFYCTHFSIWTGWNDVVRLPFCHISSSRGHKLLEHFSRWLYSRHIPAPNYNLDRVACRLSLSLSPLYSIICLPYSGQHPAHTAGIVISIRNRSATKSKFRCWEPTRLEQNGMCFSKACHLLCMLIVLPHPGWTLAFFFFWCVCVYFTYHFRP